MYLFMAAFWKQDSKTLKIKCVLVYFWIVNLFSKITVTPDFVKFKNIILFKITVTNYVIISLSSQYWKMY